MIDVTDTPHGLHLDDDPVTRGWRRAVLDVQAALDGAES